MNSTATGFCKMQDGERVAYLDCPERKQLYFGIVTRALNYSGLQYFDPSFGGYFDPNRFNVTERNWKETMYWIGPGPALPDAFAPREPNEDWTFTPGFNFKLWNDTIYNAITLAKDGVERPLEQCVAEEPTLPPIFMGSSGLTGGRVAEKAGEAWGTSDGWRGEKPSFVCLAACFLSLVLWWWVIDDGPETEVSSSSSSSLGSIFGEVDDESMKGKTRSRRRDHGVLSSRRRVLDKTGGTTIATTTLGEARSRRRSPGGTSTLVELGAVACEKVVDEEETHSSTSTSAAAAFPAAGVRRKKLLGADNVPRLKHAPCHRARWMDDGVT